MKFTFQDLLMVLPIRLIRTIVIVFFIVWIGSAIYGFCDFVFGDAIEFSFLGFNMKK